MNEKTTQLLRDLRSLSHLDFSDSSGNKVVLEDIQHFHRQITAHLNRIKTTYLYSPEYLTQQRSERSSRERISEMRREKERAVFSWAKKNLKPDMWVKVGSSSAASRWRKIIQVKDNTFIGLHGAAVTGYLSGIASETGLGKITKIWHPVAKKEMDIEL